MILYRALRLVLKGAVQVFFVQIEASGTSLIPKDGAVIFAANHPNSIMDTVILGTHTPRQVHYMARSGLFKNPVVAWIFHRCGVIPLYRRSDLNAVGENGGQGGEADGMSRAQAMRAANDHAFQAAYEVLCRNGTIGIFPEGQNAPERHVREIKTGTARIALGALEQPNAPKHIWIVPVGLNFEDRDRFLSSVLVRFGEPIDVAMFAASASVADASADRSVGEGKEHTPEAGQTVDTQVHDEDLPVRRLTDAIQASLRSLAVHISETRTADLAELIHRIYGHQLLDKLEIAAHLEPEMTSTFLEKVRADPDFQADIEDEFYLRQRIADAIEYYEEHDPAVVERIRTKVRRYRENLAQVRLRENFADRPPKTLSLRREAVKTTLYAVLLAPIFCWGTLFNALPFILTLSIARKAPDEAIRAFTGLFAGTFAFGLAYTGLIYGAVVFFGALTAIFFGISLPITGLFALRYRQRVARYRDRLVVRTLFLTRSAMLRHLLAQRAQLLSDFDVLATRFMEATMRTQPKL